MAGTWSVVSGQRTITVHAPAGPNEAFEAFHVEIRKGGTLVMQVDGKLNAQGNGTDILILPAGTYSVKITAPSLGVNGQEFTPRTVTDGDPPVVIPAGGPGMKLAPVVSTGTGTLTVSGSGTSGEAIKIVVSQNGTQVATFSGTLDSNTQETHTFTLPAGTFDVEVTAPDPGGTVYDYLGEVVS